MRHPPSPLMKAYYRPIEAAIRWSDLHRQEQTIFKHLGNRIRPEQDDFPRWPKLYLNSERIFCALVNGDLPYGKNGVICLDPSLLDNPELTICEVHLKAWLVQHYPEEKPRFLFNPSERKGMSRMAAQRLLAENNNLTAHLNQGAKDFKQLKEHTVRLKRQVSDLKQQLKPEEALSERGRAALLNIIGGLLTVLRGSSPGGQRYSQFDSDAAIIQMIISYHRGRVGISERTMQKHFAAARRSLDA